MLAGKLRQLPFNHFRRHDAPLTHRVAVMCRASSFTAAAAKAPKGTLASPLQLDRPFLSYLQHHQAYPCSAGLSVLTHLSLVLQPHLHAQRC
jgi:hypothetical protein